jgi:hypothetical protein
MKNWLWLIWRSHIPLRIINHHQKLVVKNKFWRWIFWSLKNQASLNQKRQLMANISAQPTTKNTIHERIMMHTARRSILAECKLNLKIKILVGKKPDLLLFFWFLEQFFDSADSCFLCQYVACHNCYSFFRAPFDALGAFGFVFTHIADVDNFGFWMQHNGAVVTGFDAPTATVAFVIIEYDVACVFGLCECISWARSNASWFFAQSACYCHVS